MSPATGAAHRGATARQPRVGRAPARLCVYTVFKFVRVVRLDCGNNLGPMALVGNTEDFISRCTRDAGAARALSEI